MTVRDCRTTNSQHENGSEEEREPHEAPHESLRSVDHERRSVLGLTVLSESTVTTLKSNSANGSSLIRSVLRPRPCARRTRRAMDAARRAESPARAAALLGADAGA